MFTPQNIPAWLVDWCIRELGRNGTDIRFSRKGAALQFANQRFSGMTLEQVREVVYARPTNIRDYRPFWGGRSQDEVFEELAEIYANGRPSVIEASKMAKCSQSVVKKFLMATFGGVPELIGADGKRCQPKNARYRVPALAIS